MTSSERPRCCDEAINLSDSKNEPAYSLVDRNELPYTLGLTPTHKVIVYIGRIAVEKNVQALIDVVDHLDDSWHAVIIGPEHVLLERVGPRVQLLYAQRRNGN